MFRLLPVLIAVNRPQRPKPQLEGSERLQIRMWQEMLANVRVVVPFAPDEDMHYATVCIYDNESESSSTIFFVQSTQVLKGWQGVDGKPLLITKQ